MTQDEAKGAVARHAVGLIEDGMRVGLGTGTTATLFIRALAERVKAGLDIRCVASSDASHDLAASLGLNITDLDHLPHLDIYVDGADEVSVRRNGALGSLPGIKIDLIKGGGGALLREKIVASSAERFVVVVDSTKIVDHLGAFPLPVEVIRMALPVVQPKLEALGLHPRLRQAKDASGMYVTDEGNCILDCACGEMSDPNATAAAIRGVVGVVDHGLFLGMAAIALVAGEDGVSELRA